MTYQDKLVKNMENKIEKVNEHINDFQSVVEKFPSNVDNEVKTLVKDLNQRKGNLEEKVSAIKKASDNAFADLEIGVQIASKDLDMAYQSAKERFKRVQS